jgi:multiple sugar transport system permease protein
MKAELSKTGGMAMNPVSKKNLLRVIRYVLYLVLLLIILFPIYWIFSMSFKNFKDIISMPPRFLFTPTLNNYREVLFNGESLSNLRKLPDFIRYVLNSITTTFSAVSMGLLLGLPAAYVLGRGKSKVNDKISANFMSYRFAPELAVILPLYNIFKNVKLYDTFAGMILVHQLIVLPLIIWIMRGFFRDIPKEIEEAAKIDGANVWTTFLKVMLPIARSGIGSAMIIAFVFSWNNLLFGLVMSGARTMPVTMGILQAMTFDQIKWGEMAAAAVISSVPGILIAVFAQGMMVKGMTMGAIK